MGWIPEKNQFIFRDGGQEEVQVWALLDGLIIVVDTCRKYVNTAKMGFVYEPNEAGFPRSVSGSFEKFGDKEYLVGSCSITKEGLPFIISDMESNGSFIRNWPREVGLAEDHFAGFSLVCEQDYSCARERLSLPEYGETKPQWDQMVAEVVRVEMDRMERLPLWVKQMTGVVPMANNISPGQMPDAPAVGS